MENGSPSHENSLNVGDVARQNTVARSVKVQPGVKDNVFGVVLRTLTTNRRAITTAPTAPRMTTIQRTRKGRRGPDIQRSTPTSIQVSDEGGQVTIPVTADLRSKRRQHRERQHHQHGLSGSAYISPTTASRADTSIIRDSLE